MSILIKGRVLALGLAIVLAAPAYSQTDTSGKRIHFTDLKLCAYLRLNLTSKEIAQLLNISLKGVEVSRYRLRKKLNLATEINLHDFLIEITG